MEFPTYEEMAQNVAEKALDGIEYEGKTLREWIEIILATDTNVATKLSTNLAEVGTDCISRQAAIDALCNDYCGGHQDCKYYPNCENLRSVQKLSSAQPDIIRCRNCKFASGDSRICMKFGHSPIGELDFCAWAERRTDE